MPPSSGPANTPTVTSSQRKLAVKRPTWLKAPQRKTSTQHSRDVGRLRRSSMPAAEQRLITRMMWWWFSLVVFAAAGGLVFPSFITVYAVTSGWDATGQYIGLVVAGALQGLLLGLAQVIALRRGPLRVPVLRWILATTLACAVAWLIGLIPGSVFRPDWTNPGVMLGMIAVILLVLVLVPLIQWTLLRPLVRDAWRWVVIAVLAFSVAIGVFLAGLLLTRGTTRVVTTMLTFSLMGWLGVIAYTLITGLGLVWMAREATNPAVLRPKAAPKTSAAAAKTRAVANRVGARFAPLARKVGATTSATAKKVGAKVAPATKKAGSKVRAVAKKVGAKVGVKANGKSSGNLNRKARDKTGATTKQATASTSIKPRGNTPPTTSRTTTKSSPPAKKKS